MRNIIIVILILCGVQKASAQNYIEFNEWSINVIKFGHLIHPYSGPSYVETHVWEEYFYNISSTFDTTTSIPVYYMVNDGCSSDYSDYGIDANEILFYVDTADNVLKGSGWGPDYNWLSQNSYILYDYNLQIGDTVNSIFFIEDNGAPYFVTEIDTIDYDGVPRRTFVYKNSNGYEVPVIQGIGSLSGFMPCHISDIEMGQEIICVRHDGEPTPIFGDCSLGIDESDEVGISLFPNPFQDNLQLQFTEKFDGVISIMDLQGKVCLREPINSLYISLIFSFFKSGIYILNLMNAAGEVVVHKKIVKQ